MTEHEPHPIAAALRARANAAAADEAAGKYTESADYRQGLRDAADAIDAEHRLGAAMLENATAAAARWAADYLATAHPGVMHEDAGYSYAAKKLDLYARTGYGHATTRKNGKATT